jgi:hypothetical protein
MNKVLLSIATLILLSTAFAGCSKKSDGGDTVDAGNLDETAVYDDVLADTGFQVAGGLATAGTPLAAGDNGSAASARVVDNAMDDSGGALDKADFLVDARAADGTRVQAVLKSMVTGADVGLDTDLLGGAGNNVQVFGTTGLGPSEFPETKAYMVLFGLSRIKLADSTLERSHFTQVFVTKGIRDSAGALATAVDEKDLEMHIILGSTSTTGEGPAPIPDVADGYFYYYFENVKLKQLKLEDKAAVGSKLSPPEKKNVPPVVVARVLLPNGTAATSGTIVSTSAAPGNLSVFLDASLSEDSDGTIEAFSWDVKETNATGVLIPAGNQSKPSGSNVTFVFTTGGLKAIGLRIIDNDGGIANTTMYFFVDYLLKGSYKFQNPNAPTGAVGGGPNCVVPNNCNEHNFAVAFGAQKIKIGLPVTKAGQCNTGHIDLIDPANKSEKSGSTTAVELDAAKIANRVGKWKASIWYTAQATCEYTVDIAVTYTPTAAPAA